MADEMMTVFGCEKDERLMFERYANRFDASIYCYAEPLGMTNVCDIPRGNAVSVNHMAPVDARLIKALRRRGIQYLSSRSIGLDHIDKGAAKAAGIRVESVAYSPQSMAEYTIMMILMALRNAGSIIQRAHQCDFRLEGRRAPELRDMTVGIVGTGRIGTAVIERLSAFGCAILAYDPRPTAKVDYVDLDELLKRCDLVTLHLPLNDATWHILDRARIARMPRGAIIVNTARGALIDTDALADALACGNIACAALDVVEGETSWFYHDCSTLHPPPFARLLALPNAIITPHTAFYTEHALHDIVHNTITNCLGYRRRM